MRLAPLYDIASIAAYPRQYKLDRAMMAMSVNGKYQNNLINEKDWRGFAKAVSVEPDEMIGWVYEVVSHAPDAFAETVASQALWVRQLDMTRALLDGVATSVEERLHYLNPPGRMV